MQRILAHGDRGAVVLVVACDRRLIGHAPIDGDLLWHAMAADRLGEEALGGLLIAFLCEEKVDRLACFIGGAIEIAPLASG